MASSGWSRTLVLGGVAGGVVFLLARLARRSRRAPRGPAAPRKVVYIVDAGSSGTRLYRYTDADLSGALIGSERGACGGGAERWVLAPPHKPPAAEVMCLTDCLAPSGAHPALVSEADAAMRLLARTLSRAVLADLAGTDFAPGARPRRAPVVLAATAGVRDHLQEDVEAISRRLAESLRGALEPGVELLRACVLSGTDEARYEAAAVQHAAGLPDGAWLVAPLMPDQIVGVFSLGGASSQVTRLRPDGAHDSRSLPVGFKRFVEALERASGGDARRLADAEAVEGAYLGVRAALLEAVGGAGGGGFDVRLDGAWVGISSTAFAAGALGLTLDEACWQGRGEYAELNRRGRPGPWHSAYSVLRRARDRAPEICPEGGAGAGPWNPTVDLAQVMALRFLLELLFSEDALIMFRRNWQGVRTNFATGLAVGFIDG